MDDLELKAIWQSYNKQLEEARILNLQSWALNLQCFKDLQTGKVHAKLRSLVRFKIMAVLLGIIWAGLLGSLIFLSRMQNPYFTISLCGILFFTLLAIVTYTRHIVLLQQIRFDDRILKTQEKLNRLIISTFQSTRIQWLQLPLYSTWFWREDWIPSHGMVAIPITLLLTFLGIYLYRNITPDNMDKKWVHTLMMAGPEYSSLIKANEMVAEIEEFRQDVAE